MAITYKFSGHESFPCKSLWLKKGYDFVVGGNDFNSPDAVITLGLWCYKERQKTKLGNYLFDESKGKDKYLEDTATLWLLHLTCCFPNL